MAVKKSILMKSGSAWVKRQTVADLARFPEENPNPVMRADDDGTLIYANPTGKTLLKTLGWRAGDKLPAIMREQMGSTAAVARAEFDLAASDRVFSVASSRSAAGGGVNLYFRDVTERRQVEEALRRLNAELERRVAEQTSEIHRSYEIAQAERQRLYDVLETLPVYVVLLTPDYHVPFANRFFEERFGKSEGQRCFEYLFQRTEPCEDCETYKILKTHAPHHWEWTGPDGRNYDIYDFPFTDSDGSPLIMEMGIDITEIHKARAALEEINRTLEQRVAERTSELAQANDQLRGEIEERRKAEAELLQAKEQWERTFNTVPDLIAILDNRHRISQVNLAMARTLRIEPEQCVGLHCFQCVHGTNGPPKFCPHARTMIDGQEHMAEVHEERLGGDFLVSTTPMFGPDGKLTGSVHVARDITERKRAERVLRESREDLRRAQAVAHVGSWRMDVQRNVLLWSEENHSIFSIPEGTPMTYETFLGTVHPDDREFVHEKWSAALRGEPYDIEHRIVVDDQVKWVRERAGLEFDDKGSLLGGFGTTQDITELKHAEQALRELNETLEQKVAERTAVAERRASELSRLAAELSRAEHKERQRLARILHDDLQQLLLAARLRLMGVGRDNEGMLHTEVEAVDELLGECLGASRDLTMELSPPILHRGALREVFEWLGGWFGEKHGFKVEVNAQERLPSTVEHVRVFLFQAVRELLFNAMKHSGAMEARISLLHRDGNLAVQVEDCGSDFDPAAIERTFDHAKSFGLLSIRERLEALEGRLEIERTSTGGACFRLVVPASNAMELFNHQVPADRARQSAKTYSKKSHFNAGTIRLLVVDDHKVVREGFVSLLSREPGFEVVGQAADGQQAVRQAEALRPDVIVMDVEMPTMDGIEATSRIKQQQPDVLIVGLSLHEEESVVRAITEAGAAAHLSKHGPAEELVETIRRVCGRESPPSRSPKPTAPRGGSTRRRSSDPAWS